MDDERKREREEIFKTLYHEHFNLIFIICMRYTNQNRDEAYDIVQNTFMKAYMHMDEVRDRMAHKSWLSSIAINECKNYLKGKMRTRSLVEKFFDHTRLTGQNEEDELARSKENKMIDEIHAYINKMDDVNTKKIVELFYVHEKRIKEISETLKINVSTITTKLNRFRAKLSKDLVCKLLNK